MTEDARVHIGPDGAPRTRRYIDLAGVMFVEFDREGRITMLNRRGSELLGVSEQDVLGKDWFELFSPEPRRVEQRKRFAKIFAVEQNTGHYDGPVVTRDGREMTFAWSWSVEKDETGRRVGVLASGEDITNLRLAQKELEDTKLALDASSIVAMTDARGVITYVNDKFCEISKYSREELIGRTHKLVNSGYHSPEFFRDMWGSIEAGKVWVADIRNKAKDGSFYWVATTIVPFLNHDGKPYQYLAIRNEITARKQAEEALERAVKELAEMSTRERARADALDEANQRIVEEQSKVIQAEKLSSIGMLSAGVAHEINNPLAGVMACVKALREGNLAPDRREEYFEAVRDGLERIRVTVKGLLDYARPQPTSISAVDVNEAVSGCLLLLAAPLRKKHVEVDLRVRPKSVYVRANRSQLMQAVMNVMLNALHASAENTRIDVSASFRGNTVAIAFRDHGSGIPHDILAKVTDPFFTTKKQGEGTGLGLAVTLGILESHGGSLEIDSEVGKGTIVTFLLPADQPAAAS